MNTAKTALGIGLVLALLAVVACTPAAPAITPSPPVAPAATPRLEAEDKPLDPPVTMKLGTLPIFSAVTIYTAIEKGFFKEQGLNMELVNFDTAAKMTAPLSTGELHVGAGAISAGFFNAILRGLPLKVVADYNSAAKPPSTLAFVVRKDLADSGAIKDFPDWKGRTVSLNALGITSEIYLDVALKKGGLTVKDINLVMVPFDQVAIAMSNKSVDIGLSNEPFITMGIDQGILARLKDVAELEPGGQISVILYSPVFASGNPEAAKRWALAYLRGIRYYDKAIQTKEGRAEVVAILGKYSTVRDPSFYERVIFPTSNPDGYVNEKSVAAHLEWYVANGQVKEKIDLATVIDNQYVDYAIRKLGRYR